jgi:hypothetical protein
MDKIYEVWAYNIHSLFGDKEGWDSQYFYNDKAGALEYAKSLMAEEVYIDVYQETHWENDHIAKKHLQRLQVA